MYLTGFADEAAPDIDGQIRATKELGWKNIESRLINDKNIHDIPDEDFNKVRDALEKSGVRINCFGSAIANWAKKITDPFDITLMEMKRAIPRMQAIGTKMIRIMSYGVMPDRSPDDQMEQERFARLGEMKKMFDDAGITPVHENCMNYGGMGWNYTLKLLENVPGLKLVFDTGNPVFTDDRSKTPPYPKQSSWEFYSKVKEHVAYVHIKDGKYDPATKQCTYDWPGEGNGCVRQIVTDLVARGYNGGFSMEPHMVVVFHEKETKSEGQLKYENYIEYGRRFKKLLIECGAKSDTIE